MTAVREGAARAAPSRTASLGRRRRTSNPRLAPYLFLLPYFLLFIPFGAGAVVFAFVMAFLQWPIGGSPSFDGLANFATVGRDPQFSTSLWNTFWMLVAYLVFLIPLSMAVAVGLSRARVKGRRTWQLIFFLPVTGSLVVVSLVFQLIYDQHVGVIAGILQGMGLPPIPFLTDPALAPWAIIVLRLWRVVGYYAVILYAGMQTIPEELYEAASIDGAGAFRRFRFVTAPLLRPSILFVSVAATVGAWELFAEPQILTGGGPARATLTSVMYIYQTSFLDFDLGSGAAAAVLLAICVVITTLILQRVLRSKTL